MLKVPAPAASEAGNRPTVLLVGRGEAMDAALRLALDRHKLLVEEVSGDVHTAVLTMAPDLVLLVGDAASDGGRKILDQLSSDASVAGIPVAVLGAGGKLGSRVAAYRHGAVAVIPRTASADAIATRVALLVREIQERAAAPQAELGEATFDELVDMVSRELRSGILSVQSKDGEPMRVVLGAGRPVAAAVEEFVRRLRPLVARAEPLNYELHVSSGGQVGLLDAEPGPESAPIQLEGLRVLLVDTDPARADTLAQELRARKVVVSVADASGRGLDRARNLDPEIVILDAAGMEGPGFDVLRSIRRDVRLRWASMLVAPWEEIWPDPEALPDVARLAERIAPLVVHDRQLAKRAATEAAFDTRLEATGPCRLLRILSAAPEAVHVTLRSRSGSVELDLAEGLLVGAQGTSNGATVEGISALAAILAMGSARVHVERRANPATANLMTPVEEALARATEEAKPLPLSQPPPQQPAAPSPGSRKRPFPAASELREAQSESPGRYSAALREDDTTQMDTSRGQSRVAAPTGTKGLSWGEPEGPKVPQPRPAAKAAFAALFQSASGPPPSRADENTALFDSSELARLAQSSDPPDAAVSASLQAPDAVVTDASVSADDKATPALGVPAPRVAAVTPRKPTLVMGGPVPRAPALPTTGAHSPDTKARGEPITRNTTLTMGSAPPQAASPEPPKSSALSAFGPIAKVSRTSSAPPKVPLPVKDETLDETDGLFREPSIHDLVVDSTSLPPGSDGAEPLASVSAPPPMRDVSDPPNLGVVFTNPPAASLDDVPDTITSAPPLPGELGATGPSPTRRRDIGNLATIPATPAHAPPSPAFPAAPPLPATAALPAIDPPSTTPPAISAWPTPPPGDTVKMSVPPSPGRSGVRAIAWVLVALGGALLVLAGVALVWTRVLGRPMPWDTSAGEGIVAPIGVVDVGPSALDAGAGSAASDAPIAAVPAVLDAGLSARRDAGHDAPVPDEAAPPELPPGGDPVAEAARLVTRAEDASDPVAETLYRQALALDPRNHYAMLGIAEILMRRGDAAGAVPLIEGAIARRRNRASYRVLLGDARRDAGDAAGARRAWEEALELEPDNRAARSRLGL